MDAVVAGVLAPLRSIELPSQLVLSSLLCSQGQSVVAEALIWAVVYGIFSAFASRFYRWLFKKQSWWNNCIDRSGMFTENAQDDVIVMSVFGTHHLIAGGIMMLGSLTRNAEVWRHGYLMETGFELFDIAALAFSFFPYTDFMRLEAKIILMFHHVPATTLAVTILTNNLNESENLQRIGAWLLCAGGVNAVVCVYCHTLNLKTQIGTATIANTLVNSFYVYCRFYVFPTSVYGFIQEDIPRFGLADSSVATWCKIGAACLTVFNTMILVGVVEKNIRYIRKYFDNKIDLEDGPVAPPKEERLKNKQD